MEYRQVIDQIIAEMARQDAKWGINRVLDNRTWITILVEEVGEVAHASLQHDPANYREELVQVAAVCIQAVISLEAELMRRDGE